MSVKKKKNTTTKKTQSTTKNKITNGKRILFTLSVVMLFTAFALLFSFISYFMYGNYDQDIVRELADKNIEAKNWLGKVGAYLSDLFIYRGFGVASFLFVKIAFLLAYFFAFPFSGAKLRKILFWDLFAILIISVAFGYFGEKNPVLGGVVGYEINQYLQIYLGKFGTMLLVIFAVLFYLVFRIKMSPESFTSFFNTTKSKVLEDLSKTSDKDFENNVNQEEKEITKHQTSSSSVTDFSQKEKPEEIQTEEKTTPPISGIELDIKTEPEEKPVYTEETTDDNSDFIIESAVEEDEIEENLAAKLVDDFGEFDPTLELSNYQFPTIDLLIDHSSGSITINQSELEENKNKIVETLSNYKIGIDKIKATVGPTVTLYEIIPEAGVRISKIKNLEDDIALSLSALGIRIIAPIPGRGTIGIEVPNTKPTVVSMKSLISSAKFQNAEMELPIALGKTISNETFVVDLAKMPHLLMAGATGQGKSVGLNAVLTSLLYKKHPAEVKFVLVDPKKVELTLFNKIERHYLAKLPDSEDAIITDNSKVINTLNSLCIEMDNRYSLLKDAMVRNIKEYNVKFKQRKLNPENGHHFLPYIVLVVDEFADLIMTAGKEVETPIARLAQLARAIGIHLIIATQRPSVNVITGIIKANFPARIAFRVSSKIDSRTILDGPGADQLIGRGDLLYTQGNDVTRVQCGFVDTPEVEKITEFIGSQKAYPEAYLLPEYVGEEGGTSLDIDISERDVLFREAAEVIVTAQQGSASLLQRKLKLGYNRAGRLIDQLEAAGIVGPFEGSKARSVNIPDLISLEEFLNNEI
ncbi:DNA translocase FtsK [Avrilella dinanensis]|uniref:Cell division protein FtsK n=1 Tax=Avrilella dinanensis TaxID=2008672 RepID=A0A2M9R515_9FLAO|nr:DNA translocase FtsK [Avrilella dinanensis]PJR03843.1 cell division protein FtsK [Avrilella dinanensis]